MMLGDTCGTCARFQRNSRERLVELGFGQCALLPVWIYPSQHARCRFDPNRWEARPREKSAPSD